MRKQSFIDCDAAAEEIGIAEDTLKRWRAKKKGPSFYKVGGQVRYTLVDVREWIEAQKVEAE